ncbi:hypothetical protein QWY28_13335 [Nocardioides sp. SOB77]|uniref:Uncharacterized protein n=1 Tax=Nocardioides oceani TaxID=3058369 RepID=A0ABT8FGZ1_9ACTN|nr:hypothetical protein [Nocardioides oceani]MDN4173938.1 hypothetical protein [Nocardioides oceani]
MTDVLAAIDATIDDWEASPHSWVPGDPLHQHPYQRGQGEGNCVRPMIQIIDENPWYRVRCEPCQVSWAGPGPCWVCGTDRPVPERPILRAHIRPAPDAAAAMQAVMATVRARLNDRMTEQLAELQRLAADLSRSVPPRPPRHVMDRCFVLPQIANPAAPTRAELAAAVDIGHLVLGLDLARPDVPPVVAVVRRPPLRHRPVRLSIDGHAYRRRTQARAHRRNR